ncbi:unnamed protein product, partial [Meganyctiphanes norvegica]
MSETFDKEDCTSEKRDIDVKHSDDIIKPNKNYYPQDVLRNSASGISELKVKEEIEENGEPIIMQDVEIKCKGEIQICEEPIDFTGQNDQCSKYDKAFSNNSNLVKHLSTHTGEKPYQCSQFGKSFSQNTTFRIHQGTHTLEKRYKCSQWERGI